MTVRSWQCEQADNVVQFPRDLKLAPPCAQCRIPMVVVRGEPEPMSRLPFRSPMGVLSAD